jgi:hypothetical protein
VVGCCSINKFEEEEEEKKTNRSLGEDKGT